MKPVRLITNLLEPKLYPAMELVTLYHERWECELVYDEVKTHLVSAAGGCLDTTFRSKSPERVLQEAYGLLVAYNLVREVIAEAATVHHLEANPRARRRFVRQLLDDIADCKLSRSRRKRRNPRVKKVKMTKWPLKRKEHHGEVFNFLDLVSIGAGRKAA